MSKKMPKAKRVSPAPAGFTDAIATLLEARDAAELQVNNQEEIERQLALQTSEHIERMKSHCKRITDRLKAMGFTPELTPGALWEIMSQENLGFIIKWVNPKTIPPRPTQ